MIVAGSFCDDGVGVGGDWSLDGFEMPLSCPKPVSPMNHSEPSIEASPAPNALPDRREFLQKAACIAIGGACAAVPVGAAITVFVSPLFSGSSAGLTVRLTAIDSLPIGGPPQLFKVVAERRDGWTKHAVAEVGSVFVQRVGEGKAREDFLVFNSKCPHLGCTVEYVDGGGLYSCPCHDSTFALTGEVLNESSPSQRGLDSLEVSVRADELWVTYVDYKASIADKQPIT